MKRIDMSNVKEAGDSNRLPAGAYICVIRKAQDFPDREYLKVTYDIAKGEYKGYYDDLRADHPDWEWVGAYTKSYKQNALPMFKRFCSAVSKSNGNFVFDGNSVNADESTLTGKFVGLVLRSEEYYGNDGEKKTRLSVYKEFPVDKLADQKVPDVKRLEDDGPAPRPAAASNTGFMNVPDGDDGVPFA